MQVPSYRPGQPQLGDVVTRLQEAVGRLSDGERDPLQRRVQQLLAPVLRGEAGPCPAHRGIEVRRPLAVQVREEQRRVLPREQGGAVVQLLPGGAEDPRTQARVEPPFRLAAMLYQPDPAALR